MPYRLQRWSKQVRVVPSIKVDTTSNFSYSNIQAYLLDLQLLNLHDDFSFSFGQMIACSSNWAITPLSFPMNYNNAQSVQGDTSSIKAKESTNLFFRITPEQEVKEDNSTNYLMKATHLPFPKFGTIEPSMPAFPQFDFLLREKRHLEEKGRISKEAAAESESSNMDFILLFEAFDPMMTKKIFGQVNICNVQFMRPTTAEHTLAENNPLRFSVESPRKVLHDFQSQA